MRAKISTISLAVAVCLAMAIGIQAKTKQNKSKTGNRISVMGCLQAGATPDTFLLNNATPVPATTARNKSGSTPNEMARSEVSSYLLVPKSKVKLQNFVGQTVQVTGRAVGEQSMNDSSSATPNESSSSRAGQNELKVSSIHRISGTCQ